MSKKFMKRAYCTNCCKNVPHFRRMSGRFQETFGHYLRKMRIGPWYCLHCRKKTMILPPIVEDAVDYKVSLSKDLGEVGDSEMWSRARSADSKQNDSGSNESSSEANCDDGQQTHQPVATGVGENESLNGNHSEDNGTPVHGQSELLPEASLAADEQPVSDVDAGDWSSANALREPVCEQTFAERHRHAASGEMPEAEPAGNLVQDPSPVLKLNRPYRFTEKFRDSMVARILEGKVTISSLAKNGEYCEAELVSWIADKVERQDEKIETLEFDLYSYWRQSRDDARPNAPR